MKFSLALCTYNRSAMLQRALASLAACKEPGCEWELLLIDNNSSDNTRAVATSFEGRLPLRYIFEPTQGLSAARNRAVAEFAGEVLLFTDDDLAFDDDWLRVYTQAFDAQREAGWFGGRVRPFWPHGTPRWLHDENLALLTGLMVRFDLGDESRAFATHDPSPFGASFALRRSTIDSTGEFRHDLGVKGAIPGRGEEAEYLARVRAAGVPGHYVGQASAWHWQDPERFRWPYLYRYGVQKGITERRTGTARPPAGATRLREAAFALKAAVQMGKGRGDRARQCVINMGIMRGLREG